MPHMSLQSLHLFDHGVEVFSIILLPRGLHSPKSGTAWYSELSKKLKCRMQCTQNKIIGFMLNAPWRFRVGANELKHVGLLPNDYRVEQLILGHMFNSINGNATTYLIST